MSAGLANANSEGNNINTQQVYSSTGSGAAIATNNLGVRAFTSELYHPSALVVAQFF